MLRVFSLKCQDLSEKPQKGELVKVFEVLKDVPLGSCIFFSAVQGCTAFLLPSVLLTPYRNNKSSGTACGLSEGTKDPRQGLTAAPGLFHALPPLWEAVPAAAVLGWPVRCAPCALLWAAFPLWAVFLYPCALWRLLWAFLAFLRASGHKRTPAGCEPVRGCGCYLHFRRGFWRFQ